MNLIGIVLEGSSDTPSVTAVESNLAPQPASDLPEGLKFRYEKNDVKVRSCDAKLQRLDIAFHNISTALLITFAIYIYPRIFPN